MRLERITGFRLVAHDGDALARFYARIGFECDDEAAIAPEEMALLGLTARGWRRAMRFGRARVDLDRFEVVGAPYPAGTDAASRCFQHFALVTDDVAAGWALAHGAGAVPISRDGPVALPPSAGGVTAVKFRDPQGHPLEFIAFPDADARGWAGSGMLGIDHSAVAATDLVAAKRFYEAHGLFEGEAGLNRGPTQARLDGVDDPLVDVVPMEPAHATPHVELLHYRAPAGTPCDDWSVADVAATRIVWAGEAGALLCDPDGHLHQVEASAD